MRQFSILRYLKKFSLLIFLLSVIGSLFIYFYERLEPYLAEVLGIALTHMHMCSIFIIVSIPKQELPNYLSRNIQ